MSRFCERYRSFVGKLDLLMRQHHRTGEKLFIDNAGQTVGVGDRTTGEIREAQIFVATLGASNYEVILYRATEMTEILLIVALK